MRRIWKYLLAAAIGICSCVNPLEEPEAAPSEEAKVTIRFSVAAEGLAPTKAQQLGEDQPLTSLHLAVFGSSGYLKEYVEATPDGTPVGSIDFEDPNDPTKITTVPLYSFTARLTLTDSKRIIHFIGNGPSTLSFGYADAVLSSLLSHSGERAYWQMIRVNGIHARQSASEQSYTDQNGQTVEYGDYIDTQGNKVTDGQGYVVAADTQSQFTTVPLVRNWAKIVVEADTNNANDPFFTPISYAIVHVPDRGTLAPYSAATNGFIEGYQQKTFADIEGMGYPANLPPNTNFDDQIPDIDDFKYWDPEEEVHGDPASVAGTGWRNGVAPAGEHGAVYLYERPVPNDQLPPTFVIVYGKYRNPDDMDNYGKKCFYKIDLMTDHKYYPIYRNFQYKILIHSILSPGHATPEAAAAAAGSADVSADINARHLPDISDGHRRLAIQPWMAKTFTSVQHNNTELSVFFMSDLSSNLPELNPDAVTLEVLPMKRGVDPVITDCSIGPPNDDPNDNSYGWRPITFTTSGPTSSIRSQTLRVTGKSGDESLYRDIVITIQNIQEMVVRCADRRIKAEKGTPIDLYIDIPDGLAESMFPLQFEIEPEAMTLSPHDDNLPVTYGESISGSGKSSFRFIKTLDWDDYRTLPTVVDANDKSWRRITCHFLSNRDNSATVIWVQNNDYFYPASTPLGTFADKSFHDLQFREPIKQQSGYPLTLDFNVDRDPLAGLPEIELKLDGLIPVDPPAGFTPVSDVEYRFTPEDSHVTLHFVTADATGEVYARLSAEDYQPQSVKTHHFTLYHDIGFFDGHATTNKLGGWSNVVYGKVNMDLNKNVLFGYFDDPEALNPPVTLQNLNGLTTKYPTTGFPWTPTGPKSAVGATNYHEVEFQTNNNNLYSDISFVLSSPGYLEVPAHAYRFRGNIFTYPVSGNSAAKVSQSNVTGTPLKLTAPMENKTTPSHYSYAEFDGDFTVENTGVWLAAGQTGTITFTNSVPGTYKFFYVQFNVGEGTYNGQKQRLFPRMDPTLSAGTFDKYPGSNDQCIWLLPERTESATITLTADDDHPLNITGIVIKTFKQN